MEPYKPTKVVEGGNMYVAHITFKGQKDVFKEGPIPDDKLESTIIRLCEGPAAKMNLIEEVIVVDTMDCTVVEIKGRDIIFPETLAKRQKEFRESNGT